MSFCQVSNSPREKKDTFVIKIHWFIHLYLSNKYSLHVCYMQSIDKADTVWPHEVYRLLKETVIKQANMTMINVTKDTVHCGNIARELTYTMKSGKASWGDG